MRSQKPCQGTSWPDADLALTFRRQELARARLRYAPPQLLFADKKHASEVLAR